MVFWCFGTGRTCFDRLFLGTVFGLIRLRFGGVLDGRTLACGGHISHTWRLNFLPAYLHRYLYHCHPRTPPHTYLLHTLPPHASLPHRWNSRRCRRLLLPHPFSHPAHTFLLPCRTTPPRPILPSTMPLFASHASTTHHRASRLSMTACPFAAGLIAHATGCHGRNRTACRRHTAHRTTT